MTFLTTVFLILAIIFFIKMVRAKEKIKRTRWFVSFELMILNIILLEAIKVVL